MELALIQLTCFAFQNWQHDPGLEKPSESIRITNTKRSVRHVRGLGPRTLETSSRTEITTPGTLQHGVHRHLDHQQSDLRRSRRGAQANRRRSILEQDERPRRKVEA